MLQKTLFDIPIWVKEVEDFDDKKSKIYNFKNLDYDYTYREMHKEILNNTFKNLCSFKEGMKINKVLDYK